MWKHGSLTPGELGLLQKCNCLHPQGPQTHTGSTGPPVVYPAGRLLNPGSLDYCMVWSHITQYGRLQYSTTTHGLSWLTWSTLAGPMTARATPRRPAHPGASERGKGRGQEPSIGHPETMVRRDVHCVRLCCKFLNCIRPYFIAASMRMAAAKFCFLVLNIFLGDSVPSFSPETPPSFGRAGTYRSHSKCRTSHRSSSRITGHSRVHKSNAKYILTVQRLQ